jgi:hypothetical protein
MAQHDSVAKLLYKMLSGIAWIRRVRSRSKPSRIKSNILPRGGKAISRFYDDVPTVEEQAGDSDNLFGTSLKAPTKTKKGKGIKRVFKGHSGGRRSYTVCLPRHMGCVEASRRNVSRDIRIGHHGAKRTRGTAIRQTCAHPPPQGL